MTILIIAAVIVVLAVAAFVLFTLANIKKDLMQHYTASAQDVFRANSEQFLALAKERFAQEQLQASSSLDRKQQSIDGSVARLTDYLKAIEAMVRDFEKDRNTKYGMLEAQIRNTQATAEKLQDTTQKLTGVLANSRVRGQWGQRMAEDILNYAGLQEHIQYEKQKKQATEATIPDFTFLLPGGRKINMDVKFPLDNYLKYSNAASEQEREPYKKQFFDDVAAKIREVQSRGYINPKENTLDYVLLFIPNQQVYEFIHEAKPGLLDDAMRQKVMLCSPYSLYAVLLTIKEAHANFSFSRTVGQITVMVASFLEQYQLFKGRYEKVGESIGKLQETYDSVTKTYRNLDSRIAKIEEYRTSHNISPEATDTSPSADTLPENPSQE